MSMIFLPSKKERCRPTCIVTLFKQSQAKPSPLPFFLCNLYIEKKHCLLSSDSS